MANTSDGQQQELLRNMRGLIKDFVRDEKGFPKISDFEERLEITKPTVIKYKKIILEEDRKSLLEIFGTERIKNVKDTIKALDENIAIYKGIRDEETASKSERMQAADNMEKAYLSKSQVMYDAREYLYNDDDIDDDSVDDSVDNNDSNQKHSDRSKETEPTDTDSIEATFN